MRAATLPRQLRSGALPPQQRRVTRGAEAAKGERRQELPAAAAAALPLLGGFSAEVKELFCRKKIKLSSSEDADLTFRVALCAACIIKNYSFAPLHYIIFE